MIKSVEFIEDCGFVSDDFHHASEVGVFFVAAEQFLFAVSGDEQQRWSIGTDMIQGRILVNNGCLSETPRSERIVK